MINNLRKYNSEWYNLPERAKVTPPEHRGWAIDHPDNFVNWYSVILEDVKKAYQICIDARIEKLPSNLRLDSHEARSDEDTTGWTRLLKIFEISKVEHEQKSLSSSELSSSEHIQELKSC